MFYLRYESRFYPTQGHPYLSTRSATLKRKLQQPYASVIWAGTLGESLTRGQNETLFVM